MRAESMSRDHKNFVIVAWITLEVP